MRKAVKVKVCDRCPVGREGPATRSEVISLGGSRFLLALCEDCGRKLDREFFAWARLGEQLEEGQQASRLISAEYMAEARRVAELRAKQVHEDKSKEVTAQAEADRAAAEAQMAKVLATDGSMRADELMLAAGAPLDSSLPAEAGQWSFTEHARERMIQRRITVLDALRAVVLPTIRHGGRTPTTFIHIASGVRVVVDPSIMKILTVAHQAHQKNEPIEDRTAI